MQRSKKSKIVRGLQKLIFGFQLVMEANVALQCQSLGGGDRLHCMGALRFQISCVMIVTISPPPLRLRLLEWDSRLRVCWLPPVKSLNTCQHQPNSNRWTANFNQFSSIFNKPARARMACSFGESHKILKSSSHDVAALLEHLEQFAAETGTARSGQTAPCNCMSSGCSSAAACLPTSPHSPMS